MYIYIYIYIYIYKFIYIYIYIYSASYWPQFLQVWGNFNPGLKVPYAPK